MVLEGLYPEEQEWLVRKAALAGGMSAIVTALVRQAIAFEGAYRDLQAVDEVHARLQREGVLARDARQHRRARPSVAWTAKVAARAGAAQLPPPGRRAAGAAPATAKKRGRRA